MFTQYRNIAAYITKDGSEIRELMHPSINGNVQQSLAEATVPVGTETLKHRHNKTEEIYHILHGSGVMQLGDQLLNVAVGDTVCIAPGTIHNVRNTGDIPLKILCSCSPPYSDSDTELMAD